MMYISKDYELVDSLNLFSKYYFPKQKFMTKNYHFNTYGDQIM